MLEPEKRGQERDKRASPPRGYLRSPKTRQSVPAMCVFSPFIPLRTGDQKCSLGGKKRPDGRQRAGRRRAVPSAPDSGVGVARRAQLRVRRPATPTTTTILVGLFVRAAQTSRDTCLGSCSSNTSDAGFRTWGT